MKRLIKKALMDPEMFKGTLKQLGDKGRIILKDIEDYKFALEQAARIVNNDQQLSQRLISKQKQLDKSSGEIYSIVFEIENIDITNEFQMQQQMINQPTNTTPSTTNMLPTPPVNTEDKINIPNATQENQKDEQNIEEKPKDNTEENTLEEKPEENNKEEE